MRILGIDTSTTNGGVAIIESNSGLIALYQLNTEITHSVRLLPAIEKILTDINFSLRDINGIAVSQGPGSFTGLRIGLMTAKILSLVNDVPLVGVPTLDALAYPFGYADSDLLICPILDALKGEVYTAIYRSKDGEIVKISDYQIISIDSLLSQITQKCIFIGNAVSKYKEKIRLNNLAKFASMQLELVSPVSVAELGLKKLSKGYQDDPLKLEPIYLRRPEAEIVWEKKQKESKI